MTAPVKEIETAKRTEPPSDLPPEATGGTRAAAPEAPAGGHRLRRAVQAGLAAAALLGLAWVGDQYWTEWRFEVSTDDAYVQADIVAVAPQVPGTLATVAVGDNQPVKAGQILAIIDQRDYIAALDRADAEVRQAQAAIATTQSQIAQQEAVVTEIAATIEADKAAETFAEQNNRRYGTLAQDGFGSVQIAQQAASAIATARATRAKDEAALDAARKEVATLASRLDEARAALAASEAMRTRARLDLGYTTLTAPVAGVVGNRTLRVGQYVQPGTLLLSIVPLAKTYVVANFKETQLEGVRPGQSVELLVDTYPDAPVHGIVDSLAPASGQEFALLPPDNATGNFTKIVQRIPVRIAIDPKDPQAGRLRPGMSVTATISLRAPAPRPSGPAS